jgi:crotonobetainyl-CoA:carnitine CoA-transferase CaiB-like acyl-CoA transferase
MLNSNKRSMTLNVKTPEGKEIMEKLIRGADILARPRLRPARSRGWQGRVGAASVG